MPDAVLVDVEARVGEFVAARREALAELVRQAVDRELVELVDANRARARPRPRRSRQTATRAVREGSPSPSSSSASHGRSRRAISSAGSSTASSPSSTNGRLEPTELGLELATAIA